MKTKLAERCMYIAQELGLSINDIITFRGNYKRTCGTKRGQNMQAWNTYTLIAEMKKPSFGVTTEAMVFNQEHNY